MAIIRYAKGPVAYLYDAKNRQTNKRNSSGGDWLRIGKDINSKWPEVRWRQETFASSLTAKAMDLLKSCHHGASDVTDEFLNATRQAAFVVASGDEEGYVHPRPDLLG